MSKFRELELEFNVMLSRLQNVTIGYFKNAIGQIECVVEKDDDGNLVTYQILKSFGSCTSYINADQGKLILFPDNKTMSDMLEDPLEYHKWYKENVKL